ncbi:hypothetical protein H4R20_005196, partial [Coemansia guatemalensis]
YIAVLTKNIQNNGNTGRLFGDSLSYADIATYSYFKNLAIYFAKFKTDIVEHIKPKLTPEIIKLISTVEDDPKLSKTVLKSGNLSSIISA